MSRWSSPLAGPTSPSLFAPPTQCPSCGGHSLVTTAKVPSAESYWRCDGCGEVWNDSRRTESSRPSPSRSTARFWS